MLKHIPSPMLVLGMALAIALFAASPVPLVLRLAGLALFALLAAMRTDLALGFVPLTAPLYLIPAALSGLRSTEILLPLHEVVLLCITAISLAQLPIHWSRRRLKLDRAFFQAAIPIGLFLLAGLWGSVIALPQARGEALRELRWLVIEPVLLYGLLKLHGQPALRAALHGLLVAGACVSLLGIMQAVGIDLVPLLGQKRSFSENLVPAGSIQRAASVYGHPNNLALFVGRVWPLAASMLLAGSLAPISRRWNPWLVLVVLLCLAGLLVSFSRGGWLAALVAALVLIAVRLRGRAALAIGAVALVGTLIGVGVLVGRGSGGSEAARLLLWREAVGYIGQHPLGIGLDQFYSYHRPDSGVSLIDPSLVGTSEEYAAHPHNLLLDLWLRMGPLGVLAFGWLTWRIIRNSRMQLQVASTAPYAAGVLAACAAMLTHGLVDHGYFVIDLAIAFWLLLALSAEDMRDIPSWSRMSP